MSRPAKDEERERRIDDEIVVDAYGPEEQALGWYYLEDRLQFPFLTKCISKRATSPLRVGDEVEVLGMAPEDECEHEMFVLTRWDRGTLAVPLSQLIAITGDGQAEQAIGDWHYWVDSGYELG